MWQQLLVMSGVKARNDQWKIKVKETNKCLQNLCSGLNIGFVNHSNVNVRNLIILEIMFSHVGNLILNRNGCSLILLPVKWKKTLLRDKSKTNVIRKKMKFLRLCLLFLVIEWLLLSFSKAQSFHLIGLVRYIKAFSYSVTSHNFSKAKSKRVFV